MAGLFISFEGIDFSGKSVQANLLKADLERRGWPVLLLREPGGTEISERIRDVLLDKGHGNMDARTELLLYCAARAQLVRERIAPHLKQNGVVICDRYHDSTTAYQGYGRQIDLRFIEEIHNFAIEGVKPDVTFLIDLEPRAALQRKTANRLQGDRLEQEDLTFHQRVRNGYLEIAKAEPQRFVILDGARAVEAIQKEIRQHVLARLRGPAPG